MGCVFCATGQMGFRRHLSSGEIVAQVLHYARQLKSEDLALTNIVVMGMGEPFHNYDNTMGAIDRLNDASRLQLRRATLHDLHRRPGAHDPALCRREAAGESGHLAARGR